MKTKRKFWNNKRISKRKNNKKSGMPTIECNRLIKRRSGIRRIRVPGN